MIIVHHLNNSRSQRILWLLEEIGLPYEVKRYERDPKSMLAPPELRAVHPLGKSPVITDGEVTVAESGAIIEYLVDKYSPLGLRPSRGTPESLRYTYWLHFAEGSAMAPILLTLVFNGVEKAKMPFPLHWMAKAISYGVKKNYIDGQLRLIFNFINEELKKKNWFAGANFSAADIQMSFAIEAGFSHPTIAANFPRLKEFLNQIHERPAYQRALEKGGPYKIEM